jgi:TM2 domain-containing membrane protein YozV
MNTMLSVFFLGGWEIILIFLMLLICVGLPLTLVVGLFIYFNRRNGQKKQESSVVPPFPVVPPSPIFPKTEAMPRRCPQCGSTLKPDAPEGLCPACLLQRGIATEGGAPAAQPSFVPPPVSELAALFPQLEILECLGRGGMGAVYRARQPRLDRFVALKILAPERQHDAQFAERFEREARALARLNHPNIVTVYDFGEVQGRFYLIMEFVDGLTLRQVLQVGKLAPAEALKIVPKICEALQYAHEQGIVHRDIKPENILVDKQGRVKIADFGIAKITGLESKDVSLTGAKDVMGTPHYMAPEQVERPQTVDHRADIYSLGVVFYEMLTGELPLGKFAPPSEKAQTDVRLDEVVLHALEKEPAKRYQHASEVKTDVETIASGPAPAGGPAPAAKPAAAPTIQPIPTTVKNASDKAILPAFLLAFFFGVSGAHRLYVGRIYTGLLQLAALGGCVFLIIACATTNGRVEDVFGILLSFLICGCGIWATIDWILLACKAFTDGQGKRMTNWIHSDETPPAPSAPGRSGSISGGGTSIPPIPPLAAQANGQNRALITAPAVALMVVGAWKILSALSGLFFMASGSRFVHDFMGFGDLSAAAWPFAILTLVLLQIIPGLLILFGGWQMLQRRSYAWALAGGIISIVACSLIGFPVGIWAVIVLARDDVRSAFGGSTWSGSAASGPPSSLVWRRFALVAGGILLVLIFVVLVVVTVNLLAMHARFPGLRRGLPRPSGAVVYSSDGNVPQVPAQVWQSDGVREESGEFRKDINESFPFNPDGRFSLDNMNGRVEIHGWGSNTVAIHAFVHGRTAEGVSAIQVNITPGLDRAVVHTQRLSDDTYSLWGWLRANAGLRNNTSVDYLVRVPQGSRLENLSSVNGDLTIDGITGDIDASNVNGSTRIKDAVGNLKLNSVNGRIDAEMSALTNGQQVSLHAVNGELELALPANPNADFSANSVNGSITSAFPGLQAKREFPGGNSLKGTLGAGGATVKAATVNGSINITVHPSEQASTNSLAE